MQKERMVYLTSNASNSPGQNTRVGSLSHLQGIFPTQGLNPVSHIAGRFFTIRATREAHKQVKDPLCQVNWKTTIPAHCLRPAMTPIP